MDLKPTLRKIAVASILLSLFSCKATREVVEDSEIQSAGGKKANPFYDINHVVEIEITMKNWNTLANQQPKGGVCNFGHIGPTYDWFHAESIKVNGKVYKDVGAKKRSFCNSLSNTKPALGISIDKYNDKLKDQALADFGTTDFTLNNSKQDSSYVRQCLSYKLFNQAGIKAPLCNFAHIKVNGKDLGLYVNLEPLKKSFFKKNFGEPLGNLYEIAGEQFADWALPRLKDHLDSFNKDESLKDIKKVISAINTDKSTNLDALAKVVDIDQVIKYWAMEIILIHWDGFGRGVNNSYVYFGADGKLRLVPWGTDQVFTVWHAKGANENQERFNKDNLIKKLSQSPKYLAAMNAQVREYMKNLYKVDKILADVTAMGKIAGPFVAGWQGENETKWSMMSLIQNIKERPNSIEKAIRTDSNLGLTGFAKEGDVADGTENSGQSCNTGASTLGDGEWGWQDGQTCKFPDGGTPACSSKAVDTDSDGEGWENGRSCEVR